MRRRAVRVATAISVVALIPAAAFVVIQQRGGEGPVDTVAIVGHDYVVPSDQPTTYRNPGRRKHRHPRPTATPTVRPTRTTSPPAGDPVPSVPSTTKPSTGGGSGGGTGGGSGAPPAGVPKSGTPAGTPLKAMSGSTISRDGTVIDGADIKGGVTITADKVVIRNSRISGSGGWGVYVRSGSLTLEDTTVTGFDNSVMGDNYTATRVEVTKANDDGFKIGDNVTIQDSWCHDLVVVPGAHSDCGQVQSGIRNAFIRRNWFDVGTGDGNAALFLAPDLGPNSAGPLVVENNVLGGGNYTVQCVDGGDGKYLISDITIRNNSFIPNSRFGPLRVNVDAKISGNVVRGTQKAISF